MIEFLAEDHQKRRYLTSSIEMVSDAFVSPHYHHTFDQLWFYARYGQRVTVDTLILKFHPGNLKVGSFFVW